MEHGPVDVVAFAVGEPRFEGRMLAELSRQVSNDAIRVMDAMLLLKDEEGECWGVDLEELPEAYRAALGVGSFVGRGMFSSDDADPLYEGMVPGSALVVLAIEHRWAIGLVTAAQEVGAEVALQFRVPAEIVDDALASMRAA